LKGLIFGTAGIPLSSHANDSISGIARLHELGLEAMEMEFVHGVKMGVETARLVGKAAEEKGISLSVHAPYYINLNSEEKEKRAASAKRILDSARIANEAGAKAVAVHPGFYQKTSPAQAYETVKAELEEICAVLKKGGNGIKVGLETTGKPTQFGSISEILRLSGEVKGIWPYPDFAHIHARGNGCLKTKRDFEKVLEEMESHSKKYLQELHCHASGINYSAKGERNHLVLESRENDFDYKLMLEALKEFGANGVVICESPSIEKDALLMQEYWKAIA